MMATRVQMYWFKMPSNSSQLLFKMEIDIFASNASFSFYWQDERNLLLCKFSENYWKQRNKTFFLLAITGKYFQRVQNIWK